MLLGGRVNLKSADRAPTKWLMRLALRVSGTGVVLDAELVEGSQSKTPETLVEGSFLGTQPKKEHD